jgi:hypothetical protein
MVCGWQSLATISVSLFALHAAPGQRHRLGGGGGLVEHRRALAIGQAGEVGDHRLEVDQRFHAALRDLGLVGRVGGVPGRVLEDVAQDDARRVRAVVALADEALQHPVLAAMRLQLGQRLRFGHRRRQVHRPRARDAGRHDGLDQRPARRRADHRQHVRLVGVVGPDVAGQEFGRRSSSSASGGRADISMAAGRSGETGGHRVLSRAS